MRRWPCCSPRMVLVLRVSKPSFAHGREPRGILPAARGRAHHPTCPHRDGMSMFVPADTMWLRSEAMRRASWGIALVQVGDSWSSKAILGASAWRLRPAQGAKTRKDRRHAGSAWSRTRATWSPCRATCLDGEDGWHADRDRMAHADRRLAISFGSNARVVRSHGLSALERPYKEIAMGSSNMASVVVSRSVLELAPPRALAFLRTVGRSVSIRRALETAG